MQGLYAYKKFVIFANIYYRMLLRRHRNIDWKCKVNMASCLTHTNDDMKCLHFKICLLYHFKPENICH